MRSPWTFFEGNPGSGMLIIADHASNHVPDTVSLGIAPALLDEHIAIDIGVAPLSAALNRSMGIPAILGGVSRLVVDLNREEDAEKIVPLESDGHAIPGNLLPDADRIARIEHYWRPYHDEVARRIDALAPRLLVSLHSFTPQLRMDSASARPWQVGVLYNQDERAARIAIPLLEAAGIVTGDQLPYSGKLLNATMNRHGEGRGLAYLGLEVRQDLIGDEAGVAHWSARLAPILRATLARLTG